MNACTPYKTSTMHNSTRQLHIIVISHIMISIHRHIITTSYYYAIIYTITSLYNHLQSSHQSHIIKQFTISLRQIIHHLHLIKFTSLNNSQITLSQIIHQLHIVKYFIICKKEDVNSN